MVIVVPLMLGDHGIVLFSLLAVMYNLQITYTLVDFGLQDCDCASSMMILHTYHIT